MELSCKLYAVFMAFGLICAVFCDKNESNVEVTTGSSTTVTSTTTSSPTTTSNVPTTSSTTVPSVLENSTAKTVQHPSNRTQLLNTTSYVCSCDLTFDCDVNCCCDIDCNAEIVEAFDCSIGIEIDDFFYGEGLERCGVNTGLLCVAHDNVPMIDQKLHIPYYTEYPTYKWSKSINYQINHEITNKLSSSHDSYKFGDAILTFNPKTERYQALNVPALTIGDTSSCFLTETVQFLKSKSVQCLRSMSDLCAYNRNLMTQLKSSRLSRRPPKISSQESTELFTIFIETCKHSLKNCTQLNVSSEKLDELQEFLYDELYEEVQLTFYINDTQLVSATAQFRCHNDLMCSSNDDGLEVTKIIQNIKINFVNSNENRKERRIRKRQRGYADDELIVASRLRPLNESKSAVTSSTEMIFDYFRNNLNATELNTLNSSTIDQSLHAGLITLNSFTLRLPETDANGQCVITEVHHDSIKFNENTHTLCHVELTQDATSNFTICQQFQQQLMDYLFSHLNLTSNYTLDGYKSDVFVSKFWTPRYDKQSWTRVSFHGLPLWSPEMQENDKSVTCLNLVTSANYKFLYSAVKASAARKYENFIENLIVEFGKLDEMQISVDSENQTTKNVKIQINVQFVNLFSKNRGNAVLVLNIHILMILWILFFLIGF